VIVIEQTYISDDIADEAFVCDLEKCKGAYFERQVNDPRVSTSFQMVNTNFGFQLRVNLTQ
jgi:hypothetical protein